MPHFGLSFFKQFLTFPLMAMVWKIGLNTPSLLVTQGNVGIARVLRGQTEWRVESG